MDIPDDQVGRKFDLSKPRDRCVSSMVDAMNDYTKGPQPPDFVECHLVALDLLSMAGHLIDRARLGLKQTDAAKTPGGGYIVGRCESVLDGIHFTSDRLKAILEQIPIAEILRTANRDQSREAVDSLTAAGVLDESGDGSKGMH